MKILYAIQARDKSRLARAKELIPHLQMRGELDILISGRSEEDLGCPIKYQVEGLSFVYNEKGKIDYWKSLLQAQFRRFLKEMKSFPIEDYDLIINDFEPLSAWAASLKRVAYISLGNEAAYQSDLSPEPDRKSRVKEFVLKNYAPRQNPIGLHFKSYDKSILPSFIPKEIQSISRDSLGHYTVCLPDIPHKETIKALQRIPGICWELFSENARDVHVDKNVKTIPFSQEKLRESIATGEGCLCNADFQLTSEVLYLKKKLMVIFSKGQYGHCYNAIALKRMGVPVIHKIAAFGSERILSWVERKQNFDLSFTENAGTIAKAIFLNYEKLSAQESKTEFSISLPLRLVKSFFL